VQAFDQDRCVVLVEWVDGVQVVIVVVSGHKVRWYIQHQQQLVDDGELGYQQWAAVLAGVPDPPGIVAAAVVVEVFGMVADHVDTAVVVAVVANYYYYYYYYAVVLD
jgi:hypothetical protein